MGGVDAGQDARDGSDGAVSLEKKMSRAIQGAYRGRPDLGPRPCELAARDPLTAYPEVGRCSWTWKMAPGAEAVASEVNRPGIGRG